MNPKRVITYKTHVEKRPKRVKLMEEEHIKLELPKMLNSIGIKLTDTVYIYRTRAEAQYNGPD